VADRQLVTFLDLAKKGNPKKAPPVSRPFGVPSISRKQAGLRSSNSASLNPRFLAADRGGAQGKENQKQNRSAISAMCCERMVEASLYNNQTSSVRTIIISEDR